MKINNIKDLKNYILGNELTQDQIKEILRATLNIWVSGVYKDKKEYAEMIEKFYYQYPSVLDRPLFMDIEDENITIQDLGYICFD